MHHSFLIMLLFFPFFQTIGTPQPEYKIADGSGNQYFITTKEIEYIPVKPENSSTGMYSGGEYVKKTITPEQYSELVKKVEAVEENKQLRIKDRIKGSFAISIVHGAKEKSFLVNRGGTEISALEQYLKQLIQ